MSDQITNRSHSDKTDKRGVPAFGKRLVSAYVNRRAGIIVLLFIFALAALFIIPTVLNFGKGQAAFVYDGQKPETGNNESTGIPVPGNDGETKYDDLEALLASKMDPAIVVIDAGHGGEDYGTVHGKVFEKTINLEIAMKLGKLLEESGVKVVYTRTDDTLTDLRSRPELANSLKADLLISIHVNAIENAPEHNGTETLYFDGDKKYNDDVTSEDLARMIQSEVVKALGTEDGGIVERPGLAVLRHSEMPTVIVEVGYITNDQDRSMLTSPESQQKAAQAIYDAAIKALAEIKLQ